VWDEVAGSAFKLWIGGRTIVSGAQHPGRKTADRWTTS